MLPKLGTSLGNPINVIFIKGQLLAITTPAKSTISQITESIHTSIDLYGEKSRSEAPNHKFQMHNKTTQIIQHRKVHLHQFSSTKNRKYMAPKFNN